MNSIYDGFDNRKDPNQRDYKTGALFGNLGTGKSSFVSQFVKMYQAKTAHLKTPRRVLILDPSEAGSYDQISEITLTELRFGVINPETGKRHAWRKGVRVLRKANFVGSYDWADIICKHFRNGLLILDEARDYISNAGVLPPALKDLFTKHRNAGIDLLVVSHNYKDLHVWIRKQVASGFMICLPTADNPDGPRWFEEMDYPRELYQIYLRQKQDALRRDIRIQVPYMLMDGKIGVFNPDKNQKRR